MAKYKFDQSLTARRLLCFGLVVAILMMRLGWPPRNLDTYGLVAIRDLALTLAVSLVVIAICLAYGTKILQFFRLSSTTSLERYVYGFTLGAGALAYSIFALGLIGWKNKWALSALLAALAWWLAPARLQVATDLAHLPSKAYGTWRRASGLIRSIVLIGLLIALLSMLNALGPPWDYDGLMYHLLGPKHLLQAGRIIPYPENWYVNGPFAIEMLFSIGIALGDDVFPKLIQYAFGVLYVAGAYAVARRWFSSNQAWMTVAVLLTVPTLPVWASFAHIDLGWPAFEFVAIGAMLRWRQAQD